MTRTRKAVLTAAFTYAQFALSMGSAFLLLPFILRTVGARNYGLWLATGELVGYLGMTDLGVFSILPWLMAVAEGSGERESVRRLLANGLAVGLVVGSGIALAGILAWTVAPGWLGATEVEQTALRTPLLLIVAVSAVTCPLRIFEARLTAMQDAIFLGALKLVQLLLSVLLTWALLSRGWGLLALSVAFVVPAGLTFLAFAGRALCVAPADFRHWPLPTGAGLCHLLKEGIGSWLGNFGVRLLAASNGLVITILGHPEWVPVYVAMTKLPQLLQQLCRVLPDSALVGLAQLYGERRASRLREVLHCMLVTHLVLAGSAACLVLAANPGFVRWWLGADFYAGPVLNTLVAGNLLVAALTHTVVTSVGVIGRRLEVGVATILNGLAYLGLALGLGAVYGLPALPLAMMAGCVLTSLAWGLHLQRRVFDLSPRATLIGWLSPWALRAAPALAAAALIGYARAEVPLWQPLTLLLPVGLLYVVLMRPSLGALPLPDALRRRLEMLRLLGGRAGLARG